MKRIAVLASGSGSNLQSIIDKIENKTINAELVCVISDKKDAFALERARKHKIPCFYMSSIGIEREEHEERIVKILNKHKVDFVILAGYMRLLTPYFIKEFKNKIINIHPALLPSFPGAHGYEDAWNYGVKVSGCTVHFVDEGCDTGPIILQKSNKIRDTDTLESFKERGLKIEHHAFPEAINLVLNGKVKIKGRKVVVK